MHLTGRCNCQGIRYEFNGEPLMTGFCHCKTSQRQTGTSGSLIVCVTDSDLNVEGDALKKFVTRADSGFDVHRFFCGDCGSPIVSRCDAYPGKAFIKAGTLDDTSMLKPSLEIWCEQAQGWMPQLAGTTRLPKGR